MGRPENVEIFNDTREQCKKNERLKEAIKYSINNQKIILENEDVKILKDRYETEAKIIISKKRTFEAASAYKNQKVCVLNFASATTPGGGVVRGATAQEECLCRVSTLYSCIETKDMWNGFYAPHRVENNHLHNDDIIYTPDVIVLKSDTVNPKLLPEKDWYKVDVITCAAPKLIHIKISEKELFEIQEKRIRRILSVAANNGNEVVVLGAFGCGAYRNSPRIVAMAANKVIQEFKNYFKVIEFANYCSPENDANYIEFKRKIK